MFINRRADKNKKKKKKRKKKNRKNEWAEPRVNFNASAPFLDTHGRFLSRVYAPGFTAALPLQPISGISEYLATVTNACTAPLFAVATARPSSSFGHRLQSFAFFRKRVKIFLNRERDVIYMEYRIIVARNSSFTIPAD